MNFTEWLHYQQSLLETGMDMDKEYTDGSDQPSQDLTATANKIVASNPNVVGKMAQASNPKKSFQTAIKAVSKFQPHMNVNKRKNLQVGDIAKAVGDVAGVQSGV